MAGKGEILAKDIDRDKLDGIMHKVHKNSDIVTQMVDGIVEEYCRHLDNYMKQINDALLNPKDGTLSDFELDQIILNIPAMVYFTSNALESLGVLEDVSKAVRSEVYNKVRDLSEGTVADKDSLAELASQPETIIYIVHQRAYKKVKARIDAAYEMLNSAKKVLGRRVAEMQLSGGDRGELR